MPTLKSVLSLRFSSSPRPAFMNIYVGNLSYSVTEDELRVVFAKFGQISSAALITDKFTGQSKGFGFVEMPDAAEGQAAIDATNGTDLIWPCNESE